MEIHKLPFSRTTALILLAAILILPTYLYLKIYVPSSLSQNLPTDILLCLSVSVSIFLIYLFTIDLSRLKGNADDPDYDVLINFVVVAMLSSTVFLIPLFLGSIIGLKYVTDNPINTSKSIFVLIFVVSIGARFPNKKSKQKPSKGGD